MKKEKMVDFWRTYYSVIVPTLACIVYIMIYVFIQIEIFNYKAITESQNFINMLESVITFVSIIIGVFGFLLPILITSKDKFVLVKYFLSNIDKTSFSFHLRMIIVGGFATVFFTCMLFFADIFSEWFKQIMIVIWIWLLLYFMLNSYRFISLLIRLFLEEKKEPKKEKINPIDEADEDKLKELIKKQNDMRLS